MSSDMDGKWGAPMNWPTYPYGSGDMLQSLQLGNPMWPRKSKTHVEATGL